jgi:anti-sigma B factor antagonist
MESCILFTGAIMKFDITYQNNIPVLKLEGRFDAYEVGTVDAWFAENLTPQQCVFILDMSQVNFLDTRALALFVGRVKNAREFGGDLILTHLTNPVRIIMELTRLDKALTIHETVMDALAEVDAPDAVPSEPVATTPENDQSTMQIEAQDDIYLIQLSGRVDAFIVPEFRTRIDTWQGQAVQKFIVDLNAVKFMDSAGLAALVKLLKQARAAGGDVVLVKSHSAATMRILSLTKFDKVFQIAETIAEARSYLKD